MSDFIDILCTRRTKSSTLTGKVSLVGSNALYFYNGIMIIMFMIMMTLYDNDDDL